ncbi:hypothetical protein ACHMXJ_36000 [Pseudomonas aeruginosa]|uniref:hypothetical protein n=1 Tax=Pseudomonas aeruginosa TaxID=287 RepID=UPI0037BC4B6C
MIGIFLGEHRILTALALSVGVVIWSTGIYLTQEEDLEMSQTTFGVIMLTALLVVCLSMAAWADWPNLKRKLKKLNHRRRPH